MPPEPDFAPAEYAARLARAQRAMHAGGFDALFFTTEPEMRYFTGFRTLFWLSPTRPWYLVVPRDGAPVAIIPEIGAPLMRATGLEDVRTWASPHASDEGIAMLADALSGAVRIGMPMGRESSLRMALLDFERLRAALPGAEFADASPLMQALRQVKSEAEIALIARVCAMAGAAFAQAGALFHAGQRLDEAFRAFRMALLGAGVEDVPYLVGGAGPGGYADVISPPGPAPLSPGDVLMLDTGATLGGYFCDFDRNYAIRHAGEAARRAHAALYDAIDAGLAAARPGATCAALYRAMGSVTGAGGGVGRFGHGLGMQLTEAPSIAAFDETVLEPGMVLTLEPSIALEGGRIMVAEENIVIRDGPPELLTRRAPRDLPVI